VGEHSEKRRETQDGGVKPPLHVEFFWLLILGKGSPLEGVSYRCVATIRGERTASEGGPYKEKRDSKLIGKLILAGLGGVAE
jgi:hypothetical protein